MLVPGNKIKIGIFVAALLAVLMACVFGLGHEKISPCENPQEKPSCLYPTLPVGKSVALYTADFAKKYNLPANGISNQLNDYVDYIEIVSVPALKGKQLKPVVEAENPDQDCIVNILANKNNDISLAGWEEPQTQVSLISKHMALLSKPLQLFNLNKYSASYRYIYFGNEGAIYSADLFPTYDYFSHRSFRCHDLVEHLKQGKGISLGAIPRASIFGKFILDDTKRKKNENYKDPARYREISIPEKLLDSLYQGIEIPSPPKEDIIKSISDIPKLVMALPVLIGMQFDSAGANKNWVRPEPPKPLPEGMQMYFKLEK